MFLHVAHFVVVFRYLAQARNGIRSETHISLIEANCLTPGGSLGGENAPYIVCISPRCLL